MSVEEDTELRDIVLETLEQRGVVGRTKVRVNVHSLCFSLLCFVPTYHTLDEK